MIYRERGALDDETFAPISPEVEYNRVPAGDVLDIGAAMARTAPTGESRRCTTR